MPPMLIFLAAATITMAGGQVFNIAFPTMGRVAGLSDSTISFLTAVTPIVIIFASPWWGRRIYAFGVPRMMTIGTAAMAAGTGALALWFWLERQHLVGGVAFLGILILIRIAQPVAASALSAATLTYVAATSEPSSRQRAMARYSATISLGILLAAALVAGLSKIDLLLPFLVVTVLTLLAAIAIRWAIRSDVETPPAATTAKLRWLDARYSHWLLALAAASCALNVVQLVIPFHLMDRFAMTAGSAASYSGILFFIFCSLGLLIRMFLLQHVSAPSRTIVIASLACMSLSILVMPFCASMEALFVPFVAYGIAAAFVIPAIYSGATLSVPAEERGDVSGLVGAAPSIGAIFGAFSAGLLYERSNWLPFVILAGMLAFAACCMAVRRPLAGDLA